MISIKVISITSYYGMIYKFNQKKNNLRLGCSFFKKNKRKGIAFFFRP
ncbi:protein of unknown function [Acetoanaerobium sticklandii]|uniref:Uncharacterized protein n=1 Tax=Acetoanaerobium sticklandii (strain ATCC 12662 / DSM 519 / JCM 1433 / CCUG 9281 / NCIMB 10654 / HF) TaxID=499177 RepID=E3PXB8_ACESD|nr:protein of unknown function [Acetoanaerobium sticklandii]